MTRPNKDPRTIQPLGLFDDQDQKYPGTEAEMTPLPDFGEETYK